MSDDFNGGLFLGDDEELEELKGDQVKEKPILDLTIEERKRAQDKLDSGEMLFDEEEESAKELLSKGDSKKKRKPKKERVSKRTVAAVDQDILDRLGDELATFDGETANKKQIRNLRKALQELSLARYPKKPRATKKKKKVVLKKK